MCALRAHIKLSVFENIFSGIEKAVITFSILEKMFLKTESLMCALRAHISKIHKLSRKRVAIVDVSCCNKFWGNRLQIIL